MFSWSFFPSFWYGEKQIDASFFSVFYSSSILLLIIKVITLSNFHSSRSTHLGLVFVNLRLQHFDTECCDEIFKKKKNSRQCVELNQF